MVGDFHKNNQYVGTSADGKCGGLGRWTHSLVSKMKGKKVFLMGADPVSCHGSAVTVVGTAPVVHLRHAIGKLA